MIFLRSLVVILMLSLSPWLGAQVSTAPGSILLSGVTVDRDSLPLPGTHVMINNSRGTTTDLMGGFRLVVRPMDTVSFSHMGYHEIKMILPDTVSGSSYYVEIMLSEDTVALEEVQIYPWPSKENFKNEFLGLDTDSGRLNMFVPKISEDKSVTNVGAGAIGLSSIFKYKKFYDLENQQRQINEWMGKQTYSDYAAQRIKKAATQFTDLKKEEIDDFLDYCTLEENFVQEATDYDLALAIKKCYNGYKK